MGTNQTARFIALPYSPWSEKARWALDLKRVPYREIGYLPLLGEPWLRWTTRRWTARVTAPALVADGVVCTDSWAIACWADEVGQGMRLLPDGALPVIRQWNERSESVLAATRALAARRVAADPAALAESVPLAIPRPFRRAFGSLGLRYLTRKYGLDEDGDASLRERIIETLEPLRAAVRNRDLLLSSLSYADIVMACSLQLIEPVSNEFIRVGSHTRRGMTDETLRTELADVVRWRDRIYAAHRRPAAPPA